VAATAVTAAGPPPPLQGASATVTSQARGRHGGRPKQLLLLLPQLVKAARARDAVAAAYVTAAARGAKSLLRKVLPLPLPLLWAGAAAAAAA
jgi:hypothetical protein